MRLARINNKGFTIIELLVVISVVGLLSSIVFVSIVSGRARTRDVKRISDLIQYKLALEFYYGTNKKIPSSVAVETSSGSTLNINLCNDQTASTDWRADTPLQTLVSGGYISKLNKDPVNDSTYCYRYQSNPDSRGACMWALLENQDKVGIVVGTPSTLPVLNQNYPKGFTCGNVTTGGAGLTRIVGGEIPSTNVDPPPPPVPPPGPPSPGTPPPTPPPGGTPPPSPPPGGTPPPAPSP